MQPPSKAIRAVKRLPWKAAAGQVGKAVAVEAEVAVEKAAEVEEQAQWHEALATMR